jgi:hypothetical protein
MAGDTWLWHASAIYGEQIMQLYEQAQAAGQRQDYV